MLLRFSVTNWKSFKEKTTLSMVAGKESQHASHIQNVPEYQLNVLPTSVIFGANASGKSNLVKAINFAVSQITSTNFDEHEQIHNDFFRLDEDCAAKPSEFEFDIIVNEILYKYCFAIFNGEIHYEKLTRYQGNRATTLYIREQNEFKKIYPKFSKDSKEFISNALSKKLVLSHMSLKIPEELKELKAIYNWFRFSLVILTPASRIIRFDDFSLPPEKLSYVMSKIDSGISRICFEQAPIEACRISCEDMEQIKKILATGAKTVWSTNHLDDFYKFEYVEGSLTASKMVSYHKTAHGNEALFDICENSDGTRRCLHLFPAFNNLIRLGADCCYIIDEMDRSLHTNLVKQLLASFLETRNQDTRSQLVMTNHDVLQMDQDVLRRDEIWLIERNAESGASELCALNEFKIRNDRKLPKLYLDGQFGGVPQLDTFGDLFKYADGGENEG